MITTTDTPECEDCQNTLTADECTKSLASSQKRLLCTDCLEDVRPGEPDFPPPTCDECDQTQQLTTWDALNPPVTLCRSCSHDAFRSGWTPGITS